MKNYVPVTDQMLRHAVANTPGKRARLTELRELDSVEGWVAEIEVDWLNREALT